jgi:hypothetical protein
VGIFFYYVVSQHAAGRPNWLLTWLMVPFVLAGLWIIGVLIREIYTTSGIGTTRLEISEHPLTPGQTCRVFVAQAGRTHVHCLKIHLLCEERAIYPQGTDTRTDVKRAYREVLYRARKLEITPDAPFETEFDLSIPAGAMHSFAAPHNSVQWSLIVRGMTSRALVFDRRFPVYVYPSATAAAGNSARPRRTARETVA